jgi:hypothetical protein
VNDLTCQVLVQGMAGRLNMGWIIHKALVVLLAVVLCVLSLSVYISPFAASTVDMFGPSVSAHYIV